MRAVMLEVPEEVLAERRRLGLDGRDEMWDGVLHITVPPAGGPHQRLNARLCARLTPIAEQRGLEPHVESGLFRDESDYRVPDQLYCRPEDTSARGAEGAELVVEIRSPGLGRRLGRPLARGRAGPVSFARVWRATTGA